MFWLFKIKSHQREIKSTTEFTVSLYCCFRYHWYIFRDKFRACEQNQKVTMWNLEFIFLCDFLLHHLPCLVSTLEIWKYVVPKIFYHFSIKRYTIITYLDLQMSQNAGWPLSEWPQASYDRTRRPNLYLTSTTADRNWNHDTQGFKSLLNRVY